MENPFVNYALMAAYYEERKYLAKVFSPFLLKAFCDLGNMVTPEMARRQLMERYHLYFHKMEIEGITNMLEGQFLINMKKRNDGERSGYVTKKGGKEIRRFLKASVQAESRQKHLLQTLMRFLEDNGIYKTDLFAQTLLLRYIHNCLNRLSVFGTENWQHNYHVDLQDTREKQLITYFLTQIQQKYPRLYCTYLELYKGAIVHESAMTRDIRRYDPPMEPLSIYLDINTLLNLLQLHHPSVNEMGKTIFEKLINTRRVKIKVFSITLQEVARVLEAYKNKKGSYHPHIPVNSVYYYMRSKSFDNLKTDALVENLKREVTALGIHVEEQPARDPQELIREDQELVKTVFSAINKNNAAQPNLCQMDNMSLWRSVIHITTIILAIRKKRKKQTLHLERAEAVFLSSNKAVTKAYQKYAEQDIFFPEVLPDMQLGYTLWLKNPKESPPVQLHKLSAMDCDYKTLDNNKWWCFVKTLEKMYKEQKISREQKEAVYSKNPLTCQFLQNINTRSISQKSIMSLTRKVEKNMTNIGEIHHENTEISIQPPQLITGLKHEVRSEKRPERKEKSKQGKKYRQPVNKIQTLTDNNSIDQKSNGWEKGDGENDSIPWWLLCQSCLWEKKKLHIIAISTGTIMLWFLSCSGHC